MVRLNDGPYREGRFEENFVLGGKDVPYALHQRTSGGGNYKQIKNGRIGIVPGSAAEACTQGLIYGCGKIEFLETEGKTFAAFRDKKVQISLYLGITDLDAVGICEKL